MHRVTVYAFVIAEHRDYYPTALADLSVWLKEGKLKYKEDVPMDSVPRRTRLSAC